MYITCMIYVTYTFQDDLMIPPIRSLPVANTNFTWYTQFQQASNMQISIPKPNSTGFVSNSIVACITLTGQTVLTIVSRIPHGYMLSGHLLEATTKLPHNRPFLSLLQCPSFPPTRPTWPRCGTLMTWQHNRHIYLQCSGPLTCQHI